MNECSDSNLIYDFDLFVVKMVFTSIYGFGSEDIVIIVECVSVFDQGDWEMREEITATENCCRSLSIS
ncbi:hypothetical protein Hanom_Chr16g01420891 [Helianthus anomalus]